MRPTNNELSIFLKESLYIMSTTDSMDELNDTYCEWINRLNMFISTNPLGDVATANDVFMRSYLSNRDRVDPDDRHYELMNMLFDAMPSQYYQ